MKVQTIRIEPITLSWTPWFEWATLRRRANSVGGVAIPKEPGVYELRLVGSRHPIYIGCTNRLWRRLRVLLRGIHKPGGKILQQYRTDVLQIRWAETQRPACVEEELLRLFVRRHGRLPIYNTQV